MIHFHIITLFPESISPYVNGSILGRAQKDKKIKVTFYNPRDFTKDKHKRVDNRPYGGGPGMVIEAEPVLKAVNKAVGKKKNVKIIFFSPSGKQFNTSDAERFAKKYKHIVLISGHYEGIDARVKKILKAEEVSIGPYILTGGGVPAMVIVDAVSRFIPGVLGNPLSLEEKRTASPHTNLTAASLPARRAKRSSEVGVGASSEVYTRPESFLYKGKRYRVPKILLSGNHKEIEKWKQNLSKKKK